MVVNLALFLMVASRFRYKDVVHVRQRSGPATRRTSREPEPYNGRRVPPHPTPPSCLLPFFLESMTNPYGPSQSSL